MKPRKKDVKKIAIPNEGHQSSVLPLLILLFIIVFFVTKLSGKNDFKQIETNSKTKITHVSSTFKPNIITPTLSQQTPDVNHHPVFSTLQLPIAQTNIPYNTVLSAEDPDINDNLTMTVANLPNGIGYTCSWGPQNNKKTINCTISGVSTFTYTGDVIATVRDDKGGTVINRYVFQVIQPTPTSIPPNKVPTVTPSPAYIYPTWTPVP